ncbi:unnamed protein product [Eruca vesicaria subsp. sativa]|uniref:FKB95-like N-terminal Kelch domain-containing protein n=1 Tax=Eruca vesicaria subsp. sativa TaxID=29727 RepID=A0ABC8JC92_ERUVS|nr:unnamed protein product [Eruca vesicaria subsp. sativa]
MQLSIVSLVFFTAKLSEWRSVRGVLAGFLALIKRKDVAGVVAAIDAEATTPDQVSDRNFIYVISDDGPFKSVMLAVDVVSSRVFTYNRTITGHLPYATVALGRKIYFIGGGGNGVPSSRAVSFDCVQDTWCELPDMLHTRLDPAVRAFKGRIYVVSDFSCEVFDPNTKAWQLMVHHPPLGRHAHMEVFQNVMHLWTFRYGEHSYIFNEDTGMWEELPSYSFNRHNNTHISSCVVDDKLFFFCKTGRAKLNWDYTNDTRSGKWWNIPGRDIKQLKISIARKQIHVEAVNVGGELWLLWVLHAPTHENLFVLHRLIITRRVGPGPPYMIKSQVTALHQSKTYLGPRARFQLVSI